MTYIEIVFIFLNQYIFPTGILTSNTYRARTRAIVQHEIRGITADNIQLPEPTPEPSQEGK
jgi:hypothetical protein